MRHFYPKAYKIAENVKDVQLNPKANKYPNELFKSFMQHHKMLNEKMQRTVFHAKGFYWKLHCSETRIGLLDISIVYLAFSLCSRALS